jgi:hypothetical protein
MKCLNARMLVGVMFALSLAVIAVMNPRTSSAQSAVLDDQQLMEWARDTYARGDWIYAAIHLNALAQRNPPLLRDNPALANEVNEGLKYSIERLKLYKDVADACPQKGGEISSHLGGRPPRIDFPK